VLVCWSAQFKATGMSVYHDPDALALLFVQQYLEEQGYTAGEGLFVTVPSNCMLQHAS
jgi:hypothetical protein